MLLMHVSYNSDSYNRDIYVASYNRKSSEMPQSLSPTACQ